MDKESEAQEVCVTTLSYDNQNWRNVSPLEKWEGPKWISCTNKAGVEEVGQFYPIVESNRRWSQEK